MCIGKCVDLTYCIAFQHGSTSQQMSEQANKAKRSPLAGKTEKTKIMLPSLESILKFTGTLTLRTSLGLSFQSLRFKIANL